MMLFTPIISCFADTKIIDKLSDEDNKAISQLLESIRKPNEPQLINLTIPAYERGYKALLQYNGITKQKNPDVFEHIDAMKAKQKEALKNQKWDEIPPLHLGPAGEPENYFGKPVIIPSKDYKSISATVFNSLYYPDSSVPSSFQDTLVIYQLSKDRPTLRAIASGSSSIENKQVRSHTTQAIPEGNVFDGINNPNRSPVIAVSTYQGKVNGISISNGPVIMRSNIFDSSTVPKKMCNTSPNAPDYVKKEICNTDPGYNEYLKHMRPIIVCLNRKNPEKGAPDACDYGPMTPGLPKDKTHINMEIVGHVEFHDPILVDDSGNPIGTDSLPLYVDLTLVGLDTGGACKLREVKQQTFLEHVLPVITDKNKLSWDFSEDKQYVFDNEYADFGAICWKNNARYVLDLQAIFLTTPDGTSESAYPVSFSYTNNPESTPSDSQFIYPPINIQYGCIAEGTLIDMADGSKKKVEDIRSGDKVLTKQGGVLQVKSRIVGHDTEFVDLIYNNDEKVSLTPTHPVATLRGIVKADELKIGDTIYTRDGQTTLSSVKLRNTDPLNVYNFVLEKTDDKSELLLEDALLFAGGILVGDNNLQRKVSIAN
ncbi:Hint domain-containing protein [Photorhabdus bodei]|uniref:Hint domain-containing protein n=1 Tax=Photorhabdus bodei TaxID=2029681 RepID=UPI0032B7366D